MEAERSLEKISSTEFIRRLNEAIVDGSANIAGLEVSGMVNINDQTYVGKQILLFQCKFPNSLAFTNLNNFINITIEGCEINSLLFNRINVKDGDGEFLDEGEIGLFKNKINRLRIKDCKIDKTLNILWNPQIEYLQILKSSFDVLNIGHSEIQNNITVTECSITNELLLSDLEIKPRTIITKNRFGSIKFAKSQHNNSIEIIGGEIRETLDFYQVTIDAEVTIINITSSSNNEEPISCVYFRDSIFRKSVSVSYPTENSCKGFQQILLRATSFENGIAIKGADSQNPPCDINNIRIDCSRKLTGEISMQNFKPVNTYINGINSDASIIFNNFLMEKLTLSDFTNSGGLQFIGMSTSHNNNSSLVIENSNIGKTQFSSTNFSNFNSILIRDSNLVDISTSSIKWFEYEQINQRAETIEDFTQKREIFRQLKYAMEKQGDRIQSLVFKQYEMIAYRQELHSSTGRYDEKFIMLLNRSNSYGQNWWKPVLWAIGFTALFYYLLTISQSPEISGIDFTRGGVSHLLDVLWKNFSVFFQILNPVHVIDKINEGAKDISKMTYLLDYFYRIILSYLIFQTISAFRKYVK
jgi:hypothetical protein